MMKPSDVVWTAPHVRSKVWTAIVFGAGRNEHVEYQLTRWDHQPGYQVNEWSARWPSGMPVRTYWLNGLKSLVDFLEDKRNG